MTVFEFHSYKDDVRGFSNYILHGIQFREDVPLVVDSGFFLSAAYVSWAPPQKTLLTP